MSKLSYHLVHANLALARASLDDPIMSGFMNRVDQIDALASKTPGFVAVPSLPDKGAVFSGLWLLNVSIWEALEPLERFVFKGPHGDALVRRAAWFKEYDGPNYVLFWLVEGVIPSEVEIQHRLEALHEMGPTPFAFNFDSPFTATEFVKYSQNEAT
jgi:hypothetical protein